MSDLPFNRGNKEACDHLFTISLLVSTLGLIGCGSKVSKETAGVVATSMDGADEKTGTKQKTEADAKAILKVGLDSWIFGDTQAKFEKNHPDISFGDFDWTAGDVLMKYEFGPSREKDKSYEFSVILIFQSKAGTEIKKTKKYRVFPPREDSPQWIVLQI
jgi:hypothetical protein